MVTLCPNSARSCATVSPAGPAPITATFPVFRFSCVLTRCSSWRDQRTGEYSCGAPVPGTSWQELVCLLILAENTVNPVFRSMLSIGNTPAASMRPGRRCPDSGPWRSVSTRLIGRIEMGFRSGPISPRRHATSQGAPQTRPHTVESGFGSWEISNPNSSSPRAIAVT